MTDSRKPGLRLDIGNIPEFSKHLVNLCVLINKRNMANNRIHLVPAGEKWRIIGENNDETFAETETKKEAEEVGRRIAREKGTEFVIHNEDGTISDSDSFGNDPASIKDNIH